MRELGRGAHGVVFLKDDTCTAVKRMLIIEKDNSDYGISVTVLRELHILEEMVPHPHVVGYRGRVFMNDAVFIEMEYLPMSLRTLMQGRISYPMSRIYARHILLGLQHCHETMKIVHRDLKPENLLVGMDGNLKLADFGLARTLLWKGSRFDAPESGKYTPQMVTLWYRSKEVLVNNAYGVDVDLWSVGCIVAEMVTGAVLFKGSSEIDMIKRIDASLDPATRRLKNRSFGSPDALRLIEFALGRPCRLLCATTALRDYKFVSEVTEP